MIYYLAIAAVGFIGYKRWEKELNILFIRGVFKVTKYYHTLNDYFGNDTVIVTKPKNEEIKKELIEIDFTSTQKTLDTCISKKDFLEKLKTKIMILNINDNNKILQSNNYEDIVNLRRIDLLKDKLFLQIIITNGDKEIEIQNKIKNYMVVDNEILSDVFLKWFMMQFYNETLNDEYIVNIMDHNVNLFLLTKDSYLKIKEKTYEIINK